MQHRSLMYAALLSLPIALIWGGCDNGTKTNAKEAPKKDAAHDHDHDHKNPFAGVTHAVVVLAPTDGNKAAGWLKFAEKDGKVTITGEVTGLTANQKHAYHVHEFGDVSSKDGMATGGHYNPEGHDHGLPDKAMRHAGDFGNLQADGDGKATVNFTVVNITVAGEKNPIVGRSIIVHAKEDDGGQPTGNAGGRIAQGVIGVAKGAAAAPK